MYISRFSYDRSLAWSVWGPTLRFDDGFGAGDLLAGFNQDSGIAFKLPGSIVEDPGHSHKDEEHVGDGLDTGTVTVSAPAPDAAADTVPGTVATTATLAVGGSVTVSIDTLGDRDWYAVSLVAGQTYTFHTTSSGSNTDAFLNLRDPLGNIIASDDDSGEAVNSLISFTATTTGTYFIDAGTYNNGSTGSFYLSLAQNVAAGDAVGDAAATAGTIAVGGSINGNIDTSGDRDWYAITLTAGQTYYFRTGATTANVETDTILTLRDASGNQLATNDDVGEGTYSGIRFTATTSGTYYLDVSGFNSTTGSFNLTAFTGPTPQVWTFDQIAGQLTNGYWGGSSHRFNVAPGGSLTYNVTGLTVDGQSLARSALAIWSDFLGITFNEVATGGQLVFDDNQTGAFASASYSGGITTSAQVNVGTQWLTTYGTGLNSYSFQTYVHEIGHALGLGHGGNYNGAADWTFDSLYLNDSWATTIMSYFDQQENGYFQGQNFTRQFVLTPMVADGIATTNLYGTATTTRTGNTVYGFNNTSGRDVYNASLYPTVGYTVVDHGGIDTLDYSGFSQNQTINLNAETFSSVGGRVGNVSIARGTVIENAIGGSGADVIIGNAAANQLTGNSGNDTLIGGAGADALNGGPGFDYASYASAAAGVTANMTTPVGNAGDAADDSYSGIEGLIGSNFNDTLTGDGQDNWIYGGLGDDFLSGADGIDYLIAGAGADALFGGNGVDYLYGEDANDTLTGGAGADVLIGGAGFDYAGYSGATVGVVADLAFAGLNTGDAAGDSYFDMEGLIGSNLNDTLRGNAADNWIYGAAGIDVLIGRDGADTLIGEADTDYLYGDAGNDNLIGGLGNDHLVGGAGADTLNGGDGFDYVHYSAASAGLTVDMVNNVDNTGEGVGDFFVSVEAVVGSNFDDSIRGSEEVNWLYGGGGTDFIYGRGGNDYLLGGDGQDYLFGGAGTDVLYGEGGADRFVFQNGVGIDYIMDFQVGSGDAIFVDVASLGVTNFAQIQTRMVQSGNDTIIGVNGDSIIVLVGITPAQLTASHFVFG